MLWLIRLIRLIKKVRYEYWNSTCLISYVFAVKRYIKTQEEKVNLEYSQALNDSRCICVIEEEVKIEYTVTYPKLVFEKACLISDLERFTNFYDLEDVRKSINVWKQKRFKERVVTTHIE